MVGRGDSYDLLDSTINKYGGCYILSYSNGPDKQSILIVKEKAEDTLDTGN